MAEDERPEPSDRARELAARLIRNFDAVPRERILRPPLYDCETARLVEGTAARKFGMSVDIVQPGMRACPYHLHHAQEEMFVVLEGRGTLRVAGELLPIQAGDVIFIPPGPEYPHQLLNTSDAPLKYLSISTMETPEICEYPDSGKYSASAGFGAERAIGVIGRARDGLDYWQDEP